MFELPSSIQFRHSGVNAEDSDDYRVKFPLNGEFPEVGDPEQKRLETDRLWVSKGWVTRAI